MLIVPPPTTKLGQLGGMPGAAELAGKRDSPTINTSGIQQVMDVNDWLRWSEIIYNGAQNSVSLNSVGQHGMELAFDPQDTDWYWITDAVLYVERTGGALNLANYIGGAMWLEEGGLPKRWIMRPGLPPQYIVDRDFAAGTKNVIAWMPEPGVFPFLFKRSWSIRAEIETNAALATHLGYGIVYGTPLRVPSSGIPTRANLPL